MNLFTRALHQVCFQTSVFVSVLFSFFLLTNADDNDDHCCDAVCVSNFNLIKSIQSQIEL